MHQAQACDPFINTSPGVPFLAKLGESAWNQQVIDYDEEESDKDRSGAPLQ